MEAVITAFDRAPVMLSLCQGDPLVVTACNELVRTTFGPMLGATVREAFTSEATLSLAERLEEVVATGEAFSAAEWRVDTSDADGRGTELYLDLLAEPCVGADGAVSGVVTMAVDVTRDVVSRGIHEARSKEQRERWFAAREVLTTMQDAILPEGLPVPAGAHLAARYLLAETDAGGDWFDVVALEDGRVVMVVGDVVGHGVAASVVMGELRAIFDERVRTDGDIAAALTLLDQRAQRSPAARAATVCAALIEPTTGAVTYCTAGHPPPLHIRPGVGASYFPVSGAPALGGGAPFRVAEEQLEEDDVLMLYSDGLVERPHRSPAHNTLELSRLASAVHERECEAGEGGLMVQRVCAGLLEVATRAGYYDDITLLAAQRVRPAPTLELSLPAEPDCLVAVRRELGDWLAVLGVSRIDETVLQHSAGELVGNVVEHAYPHRLDGVLPDEAIVDLVACHRDGGVVEITVTDRGSWREPDPASERGRGLAMVQGFCDEFEISHGPTGTTACLRHRPHRDAELLTGSGGVPRPEIDGSAMEFIHRDGELAVRGAVERRGADRLRHQLGKQTQGGTVDLVLDLSEVTFLASAGVQVLFDQLSRSSGLRMMAPMGSPAQHVLELVQLPYDTSRDGEL